MSLLNVSKLHSSLSRDLCNGKSTIDFCLLLPPLNQSKGTLARTVEICSRKNYQRASSTVSVSYHLLFHAIINGVCEIPNAWLASVFKMWSLQHGRISRVDCLLKESWSLRFKTRFWDHCKWNLDRRISLFITKGDVEQVFLSAENTADGSGQ